MSLDAEESVNQGHIVLDGDPAPPPLKGAQQSHIFGHVCCGQTAGWIKMPLGTEVDLGQGHIVRWGPSPPPQKKRAQQRPGPCLLWPNGRPSQLLLSTCMAIHLGENTSVGHYCSNTLKHTPVTTGLCRYQMV